SLRQGRMTDTKGCSGDDICAWKNEVAHYSELVEFGIGFDAATGASASLTGEGWTTAGSAGMQRPASASFRRTNAARWPTESKFFTTTSTVLTLIPKEVSTKAASSKAPIESMMPSARKESLSANG